MKKANLDGHNRLTASVLIWTLLHDEQIVELVEDLSQSPYGFSPDLDYLVRRPDPRRCRHPVTIALRLQS